MHTKSHRLPHLGLSLAIATALSGCADLPTHDSSLRSVYGMDTGSTEQYARIDEMAVPAPSGTNTTTALNTTTTLPADADTPVVRTLNNGAGIVSQPIGRSGMIPDSAYTAPVQGDNSAQAAAQLTTPLETRAAAVTADEAPEIATAIPVSAERVTRHTVANTDTLSAIAQQYTGDAANWKRLAEFNGLQPPYSIRVGDELLIPDDSLPVPISETATSTASAPAPVIKLPTRIVPPTRMGQAATSDDTESTNRMAMQSDEIVVPEPAVSETPSTLPAAEVAEVTDAPSAGAAEETQVGGVRQRLSSLSTLIKTGFRKPTASTSGTEIAVADEDKVEAVVSENTTAASVSRVRVTGDFTPKAVYKAPDYASGLVMRVAPGSVFETTGRDGDWIAISTDNGSGYIFHRDVQAID
ncbi:LysM peptidoglycan-binding domain-containing protein [Granulosicoccaceae sp. 1_MG-2023]|nr:LysM peptidoglycan-binding domain-containing protein [Granulosicoccaceae sp. 1_MG-2023]